MAKTKQKAPPAADQAEALVLIEGSEAEPYPGVNPRTHWDPEKIADLAANIRENGVLQNIVVHDRGEKASPRYWIVAGESRWRAVGQLATDGHVVRLPARVGQFTKAQAIAIALVENLQRGQLTAMEEARGFQNYLAEHDTTQVMLSGVTKLSEGHISNRLRLLELPADVQALVDEGKIAPTYARDLLLPWMKEEESVRERFFRLVLAHVQINSDFGVSVSRVSLEQAIERIKQFVTPAKPKPEPKAAKRAEEKAKAKAAKKAKAKKGAAPEPEPEEAKTEVQDTPAEKPVAESDDAEDAGMRSEADSTVTGTAGSAPAAPTEQTAEQRAAEVVRESGIFNRDRQPTKDDAPAPAPATPAEDDEPLTAHRNIITDLVASMLTKQGVTTVGQLRARRDELTQVIGFGKGVMEMIDQVLAQPPAAALGAFGLVSRLHGQYTLTVIAAPRDDGRVALHVGAKKAAGRRGLPSVPPLVVVATPEEIDAELAKRMPEFVDVLIANAAAS